METDVRVFLSSSIFNFHTVRAVTDLRLIVSRSTLPAPFPPVFSSGEGSGRTSLRSDTRSSLRENLLWDNRERPLLGGGHSVRKMGHGRRAVVSSFSKEVAERHGVGGRVDANIGRGSSTADPTSRISGRHRPGSTPRVGQYGNVKATVKTCAVRRVRKK